MIFALNQLKREKSFTFFLFLLFRIHDILRRIQILDAELIDETLKPDYFIRNRGRVEYHLNCLSVSGIPSTNLLNKYINFVKGVNILLIEKQVSQSSQSVKSVSQSVSQSVSFNALVQTVCAWLNRLRHVFFSYYMNYIKYELTCALLNYIISLKFMSYDLFYKFGLNILI